VKKIDYYAVQHPWRMPKWVGAIIGGVFGFILIVSGVAIVKLTRSPVPVAAVGAIGAAPATTATPAATAPAAAPANSAVAAAPATAPAAPVAAADAAAGKHHKHHASSHHAAAATHAVASAKRPKGGAVVLANAKHDNRKLREKDALDKLLGL
jgi:hypothetical protein